MKINRQRPYIYPQEDDFTSFVENELADMAYAGSDDEQAAHDALRTVKTDVEAALAFGGIPADEAREVADRICLVVLDDDAAAMIEAGMIQDVTP